MRKFLWPVLVILAACAAPPRGEAPSAPPPESARPPVGAPAETWTVVASRVEVRAYRDGPMQRLGHNHLITSDGLTGSIALREPITQSAFEFGLPLASLVVDDGAARAAAGGEFAAPVPAADAEATRRNMLGEKLLDAQRQGEIRLTAESFAGTRERLEARVRVSLAGREHLVTAPVAVAIEGDRLTARADFRLTHAELGLQPFAVALGALKVRDELEVGVTLEARCGS